MWELRPKLQPPSEMLNLLAVFGHLPVEMQKLTLSFNSLSLRYADFMLSFVRPIFNKPKSQRFVFNLNLEKLSHLHLLHLRTGAASCTCSKQKFIFLVCPKGSHRLCFYIDSAFCRYSSEYQSPFRVFYLNTMRSYKPKELALHPQHSCKTAVVGDYHIH